MEKEPLNVEYLWKKFLVCVPLTLLSHILFFHCISWNAFLETPLSKPLKGYRFSRHWRPDVM